MPQNLGFYTGVNYAIIRKGLASYGVLMLTVAQKTTFFLGEKSTSEAEITSITNLNALHLSFGIKTGSKNYVMS